MVGSVVERAVLVPVMRAWRRVRRSERGSTTPLPAGVTSVHARGWDSDRVLLLGSGIAVGWGTLDHDMALAGQLARALSARTGRGADLDLVVDAAMTLHNASRWLASTVVDRYDAVIVTLGTTESIELEPVAGWRDQLAAFLEHLRAVGCGEVVVAGIPALRAIDGYGTRLGLLAEHHARRYNEASAGVCDRAERTVFVALSPARSEPNRDGGPVANYRMWAAEIAERTAPRLIASRLANGPVVHDAARSEAERQSSVRNLGVLHSGPEARFDRIVEQARIYLGTSAAALGFIDGDRLWYKSIIGAVLPDIPVAESFTRAALSQRGLFVVPDAHADPQFRTLVHVRGEPWIRFWAGFPIEDDHGVRVGTLSVFDPTPRTPALDRDDAVLRQLALRVQRELRHEE